jgi:hypothetical protein
MSLLKVDLRVGETLRFSGQGEVSITMKSKSGQLSRLEIDADKAIDIHLPASGSIRDVVSGGVTSR